MSYTANDLTTLTAGQGFRQKLGMYLSADLQVAINLGLRELIVNVQDEYEVYKPTNPYCRIELDTKNRIITVSDNMRGIPCGVREDGMNSLTACFLLPHSGAKHEEKAYTSSIGTNGEGNKVVCHTAKWLKVDVNRDGNSYHQEFESNDEGAHPTTDVICKPSTTKTTGTVIKYQPDPAIYGDIFIDTNSLENMLQEMSYFTKGLDIQLIIDGESKHFCSKNGLVDGLTTTKRIGTPISYRNTIDDCEIELALQWTADRGTIKGYANGLYMPDGGEFIKQFKTSLTRTFNTLSGGRYKGETIRQYLDGFVSVKVHKGLFSNQAKTALANKEAGSAANTAIAEALKSFATKCPKDFEKICTLITKMEKANAAAEKVKQQILNNEKDIEKSSKSKILNLDKLKEAEYTGKDSILLLCEGDSALGGLATARDDHTGLLALRGKMINARTNTDEKVYANDEIKLLGKAMGVAPGKYDPKKLRYGKIGIAVDADSDGNDIALLIMINMCELYPELFKEGKLYWLKTPLYIVYNKNGTREYYFTDNEYNAAKAAGKVHGEVKRCKGLGELSAEEAEESMFSDKYRRLVQLKPDRQDIELLQNLMGEDVEYRKDFIFNKIDFSNIRE